MTISGLSSLSSILSSVAINPQPLPPVSTNSATSSTLWDSALNPQPLPPRSTGFLGAQNVAADDDFNYCGNGKFPIPIPHSGIIEY